MGLMTVAAQVNAQEATDDAASQKKTAAAPKLPEYPMMVKVPSSLVMAA